MITLVYTRNYSQGDKWIPGRIEQRTGPVSFTMELNDTRKMRPHQDQIFSRENNDSNDERNLARERREKWSRKPIISEMDVQLTNK